MHSTKKPQDSLNFMPKKRPKNTEDSVHFEKKFSKLQEKYLEEGLSQETQLFLRRISTSKIMPSDVRHTPLLRTLCEICKDLLLNELEIALWALILERVPYQDTSFSFHLLYSAYAAKVYLNDEITFIDYHLCAKYSDFFQKYQDWFLRSQTSIYVEAKELNSKFLELSTPPAVHECQLINYNYYVDDILKAPSNQPETRENTPSKKPKPSPKKSESKPQENSPLFPYDEEFAPESPLIPEE